MPRGKWSPAVFALFSRAGRSRIPTLLRTGALLSLALVLTSCAGGGAHSGGGGSPSPRRPVSPPPVDPPPSDGVFNVIIYTSGGPIYVDKLELEFNQRRGIHAFYGFRRDAYERMETIPFELLERVDFVDSIPPSIFDQIILGREAQNLRPEHGFELLLTYRDNRTEPFYAFVPRLRGEKDFLIWERGLNSGSRDFEYIEFKR